MKKEVYTEWFWKRNQALLFNTVLTFSRTLLLPNLRKLQKSLRNNYKCGKGIVKRTVRNRSVKFIKRTLNQTKSSIDE